MPEYLQNQAIAKRITNKAFEMITNSEIQEKMRSELLDVKQKLQGEGASHRAAEHILSLAKIK